MFQAGEGTTDKQAIAGWNTCHGGESTGCHENTWEEMATPDSQTKFVAPNLVPNRKVRVDHATVG